MSPLHRAELDYEAATRAVPGVTRADVELDLSRLQLIAGACADTARKAWREYRATSDRSARLECEVAQLARQFTDAVSASFGLSREAALVLDELALTEFG
jgi:hypothetical protein